MVICSRCEQHVDETVRTTCPLCFTPLPIPGNEQAAAPQAGPTTVMPVNISTQAPPPPPAGLGAMPSAAPPQAPGIGVRPQQAPAPPPTSHSGARVSLTGEVYDDSMQNNAPPPSYVGGAMPTARPPGPAGPARPTSPSAARRMPIEEPAKSGSGATIAVVVVLVLALFGGGGWAFMHRTNPKDQARKFAMAQKALDWKTVYSLAYLSAEDKKKYPNADAMQAEFDKQMGQLSQIGISSAMIKTVINTAEITKVGEPTYADGQATVPVSIKYSIMGQTREDNQNVNLKNEWGIWKVVPAAGGMGSFAGGGGR